jgi:hypothetical protein
VQAISLWDCEAGMTQIDKYTYSEDPAVVAGACLGFGLCCCSVRSELDPAFALLSEHVHRCAVLKLSRLLQHLPSTRYTTCTETCMSCICT